MLSCSVIAALGSNACLFRDAVSGILNNVVRKERGFRFPFTEFSALKWLAGAIYGNIWQQDNSLPWLPEPLTDECFVVPAPYSAYDS